MPEEARVSKGYDPMFLRPALTVPALIAAVLLPRAVFAECSISTFARSDLPGAPVIFAAPEADAEPLGSVPMVNDPERGMMGGEAVITEIRDGYAHLVDITAWDNMKMTAPDGWVSAADLVFVAQTETGFSEPDPASDVLWKGQDWIFPYMIATLEACQDEWVALRLVDTATPGPIWVRGICGGQETTCDGVTGD